MDYAVIMAGGTGKRLWPLSRQARPKQVLKLLQGQTLVRHCFERLTAVFDPRNIIVLTNAGFADLVREDLPGLPYNNVIAEPAVRDTSGAIGLAAAVLTKYDPDATMAVLTADQLIKPTAVFQQALKDALAFVNQDPTALVTFGIRPLFASTELGYIKLGPGRNVTPCKNQVHPVEAFREKPDETTAKHYLDSGQYCWNSGIFVWKAKTILQNLFNFLPQSRQPLTKIQAAWDSPAQANCLQEWFVKLPKISIDFAVMEKAENVHAIRLDCQWLDVGSFAALADIISADKDSNVVVADHSELLDCSNCIVVTEDKNHLIAVLGLENIVVAHSSDATLVCHMDHTYRLKELLEVIKRRSGDKFL